MKTWELIKEVEHRLNEAVCLITPTFRVHGNNIFIYEVRINQNFVTVRFSVHNIGEDFEWTFDITDIAKVRAEVRTETSAN